MDTHAQIALPVEGDDMFKATKSVVNKKCIKYIPTSLIVRIN